MRYSSFALLAACSLAAGMTHAAIDSSTTITFTGKVTDQTCGIGIDGGDAGAGVTVELPAVHVDKFTDKGVIAGKATFTLAVSGCTDKGILKDGVRITFSQSHLTTDGYLENQAANQKAEGIALLLSKDEDGVERINPNGFSHTLYLPGNADGKESEHVFGVHYISIADKNAIKAGNVKAVIEAQMEYL